jgi:YD repeat-containing protein
MWDDEHQLITAKSTRTHDSSQTQQTTAYQYDAFGRRISKAGEFGQTRFLWDGNRLLQERRSSATPLQTARHVTTTVYEPESFVPLAQLAWTENAQPSQQTQTQRAYAQRTGTHDEIIGGLDEALAGVEGYGPSGSKVNRNSNRNNLDYKNNSETQADTLSTAHLTSSNSSTLNHPPATINYYHCDQIGTPRELTDEAGAVVSRASLNPRGAPRRA